MQLNQDNKDDASTFKPGDPNNLILVDGSGYIFRAFYGLPPMTNSNGVPVNAVFGFTSMLMKLMDDMKPKYVAVVFDVSRKTFRNDIYEEYKANRSSPPEELIPQFDLIRDATRAIGLPVIEMEGFEADDLIATYARLAPAANKKAIIISSDKDLMQLVDNNTLMLDPMKQVWINDQKVFEKFGVFPNKVIDVQSLAGDSSDNIPGVPGIGLKIAAELINSFGNLDQLLLRATEIKQNKRRENLIEFSDQALLSRDLVSLRKDVPIITSIDELEISPVLDSEKIIPFLELHGFKRLLQKLENSKSNHNTKIENNQDNNIRSAYNTNFSKAIKNYELILNISQLLEFINKCYLNSVIAIDCETTSLDAKTAMLVGISLSYDTGKACYIPLRHGNDFIDNQADLLSDNNKTYEQIPFDQVIEKIKPLLEDRSILKVGHNIKYDALVLNQKNNGNINIFPVTDTMCLSYVVDAGRVSNHKLDDLAMRELDYQTIKYEDVCGKGKNQIRFNEISPADALNYAAEDADVTLELYKCLLPRVIEDKKLTVYKRLENPLINVLKNMEHIGILVNPKKLRDISYNLSISIDSLENKIFEITGNKFNVGSPKQLGEILFEQMKIEGGKRSKNGSWQTSVDIIENISNDGHEIGKLILDWRHFSKLKSTYSDALVTQINSETNRVHTSYSMVAASTGRLSSSNPNLQNIPIRTDEGKLIRTAFEAKEGFALVSMDYSQIELRLIAHIADEKVMLEAFNQDLDIHADTASKVFNIPINEMTSDLRRKAKAINFGIIYGISPYGLAKQLKCSSNEAKEFIMSYFKRFPRIKDYMEETKSNFHENGFVETLLKRRLYISGGDAKNQNLRAFAERQAINAPIQGTAADIIKNAMVLIHRKLENVSQDVSMLMQVHDELVFEINKDKISEMQNVILPIMENANLPMFPLNVNLKVDVGLGNNWAEAH